VCSDLDEVTTKERELRALLAAGRERPGAGLRLISLKPEAPRDLPASIAWKSASDWLQSEW
jgi:hypothetical protein